MTDLTIERLTASTDVDPEHVDHLLRRVAATRLDDALRHRPLPAGDWCVRHVDVALQLDPGRPEIALEAEWAEAIVAAVARSLDVTTGASGGSAGVVHYRRREDAVVDCLAGLATRDHARAWAWRQLGLLRPDEPDGDGGAAALRLLRAVPHGVAGVVHRLVERAGPAATHRLLGRRGWAEAAMLAAAQAGVVLTDDVWRAAVPAEAPTQDVGDDPVPSGPLARRLRASGLQVDPTTLAAWAVLVLAGTDAPALRSGDVADRVRRLAGSLRPTTPGQAPRAPREHRSPVAAAPAGPPRPPVPAGSGEPPASSPATGTAPATRASLADSPAYAATAGAAGAAEVAGAAGAATSDGPEVDTAGDSSVDQADAAHAATVSTTAWGGLLFLLNSAPAAGLPGVLDAPALAGRTLPWLVQQVAVRIVPALPDDPAVLALAGIDPDPAPDAGPDPDPDAPPEPPPPPTRDEEEALDAVAAGWVAATADRLRAHRPGGSQDPSRDGRPEGDAALVRGIARRHAGIVREPGWVEVQLRLDEVDLDVRRCGLDIDPGWVWWLGQVVRFVHE